MDVPLAVSGYPAPVNGVGHGEARHSKEWRADLGMSDLRAFGAARSPKQGLRSYLGDISAEDDAVPVIDDAPRSAG